MRAPPDRARPPGRRAEGVARSGAAKRQIPSIVVDLAAWRRLRRAPAGGDWWGGRRMWTWDEAERSRREWPA
jgi:hypothetical protein